MADDAPKPPDRRLLLRLALAGLALPPAGCIKFFSRPPDGELPDPVDPKRVPTKNSLVEYCNRRADRVSAMHVKSLSIDIDTGGLLTPSVGGYMYARSPRDFRLVAKVAGTQQVDFGSNADEFWFWVRQMPDPAVYYCSHADYQKGGVNLPFPLDPEWVFQCLGMARYEGQYEMRTEKKTYDLSETVTVAGRQARRVTKFYRNVARAPQPQIVQYELWDDREQLTARAVVSEAAEARMSNKGEPAFGSAGGPVEYPSLIRFEWPAMKMKMTMRLEGVSINPVIEPDLAGRLFVRPEMQSYPPVNLATARPTSRVRRPD